MEKLSFLELNDFCLLKIWNLLDLDDSINLAETCSRLRSLANLRYERFTELSIEGQGPGAVNRILFHIGRHIRMLKFDSQQRSQFFVKAHEQILWTAVNEHCSGLQHLVISDWAPPLTEYFTAFDCLKTVEILTLRECNMTSDHCFLAKFRQLKYLNLLNTTLNVTLDLTVLLMNNPDLLSFYYDHQDSGVLCLTDYVTLLPKLEALRMNTRNICEYESFCYFDNLTKLHLYCNQENINDLLVHLTKKGIIRQLELTRVRFDKNSYEILKSFTQLELLYVTSWNKQNLLESSIVWPSNLKSLTLKRFSAPFKNFLSIIEQLKHLEQLDLLDSECTETFRANFDGPTSFSRTIVKAMDRSKRGRQLNLILPRNYIVGNCEREVKYSLSNGYA